MKFSNNYIFYPSSSELVKAIDHYKTLQSEQGGDKAAVDDASSSVAIQDNFLHTRGNFEQHHFSTNILESAQAAFESKLAELSREQSPQEWAAVQNSLGNVLASLGQQRMDVALYENAIAAFHNALEVFTQEDSPSEWATTQYNLGTAAQALGRQQGDSKLMKTSVDAYTDALLVWTREQVPEEWAITMFQLGASFYTHGKLLKGNRTFQKSVVAFKNALAGYDADNHALALAATHNSRGAVLQNLAESEENAERLQEAIRAYDTALTVCMEQQQPFHLAVLCRVNKSTARAMLAGLTQDPVLAEEVADDFEVIIECFPHALQPLCLKHCEEQMSKAREMTEAFAA
ncbi:hypothetical protein MNBD_GAMMA05-2613 [hydrothermal vent metagenome]|uniref:FOG: TPR repeat n=1 Tax=hydrothermal vent metagenome TaxID=652676 RepID=A0A3B0W484_9ZZZZ